jgi:cysteine-rich repeat protein
MGCDDGDDGRDGAPGATGDTGATGPQGPPGAQSTDVTIIGNTGSDVTASALTGVLNKDITVQALEVNDDDTVLASATPDSAGDFTLVFAAGPVVDILFLDADGNELGRLSGVASAAGEGSVVDLGAITISDGVASAEHAPPLVGSADFIITINYELGMHCTGFDFSYCCVLPLFNSVQAQVVKVAPTNGLPTLMQTYARDDEGKKTIMVDGTKAYKLEYDFIDNSFSEGSKAVNFNAAYDANGDGDTDDATDNVANAYWTHLFVYADAEGTVGASTSDDIKLFDGHDIALPADAGPLGSGLAGELENSGSTGTVVWTKAPVVENTPIVLTNPGIWDAVGLQLTPFLDSEVAGRNFLTIGEINIQPYQMARVRMMDAESGAPVINTKGQPVSFIGTEPIDVPNCANCHGIEHQGNGNANDILAEEAPETLAKVTAERTFWEALGATAYVSSVKAAAISILGLHDHRIGTDFVDNYNASGTFDLSSGTSNRLGRDSVLCQKCHADNVAAWLGSALVVDTTDDDLPDIQALYGDGATLADYPSKVVDYSNMDGAYRPADGREAVRGYLKKTKEELDDTTQGRLYDGDGPPGRPAGLLIEPLTQAIHYNHQKNQPLPDANGRAGGCQSCHPAHRQDRSLDAYPITRVGFNYFGDTNGDGEIDDQDGDLVHHDNRDAAGGCFVGRDVHSNPNKDDDGVETPEHMNAIGRYIRNNISRGFDEQTELSNINPAGLRKGLWCTNCHNNMARVLYKADNLGATSGNAFMPDPADTVRDAIDLADLANQLNNATDDFGNSLVHPITGAAFDEPSLKGLIDPRTNHTGATNLWDEDVDNNGRDDVAEIWIDQSNRGGLGGIAVLHAFGTDGSGNIIDIGFSNATTTVNGIPVDTLTLIDALPVAATDADGDITVNIASANPRGEVDGGITVPYDAAADGSDYWLSVGNAHCADCHAAPFVEGQGGVAFPINQPGKYSLMRYSKGHSGLACQACHQSIHGLYPVTPDVDETSYAQAAALNPDGTHGPVKCAACHGKANVNGLGIPTAAAGLTVAYDLDGNGTIDGDETEVDIAEHYDAAVTWIHATTGDTGGNDDDFDPENPDANQIKEVDNPLAAECGNGTVEGDEECDDGNTDDGDGCAADCTVELVEGVCGDGTLNAGEECDDGNTDDGDGCSATCTTEGGGTIDGDALFIDTCGGCHTGGGLGTGTISDVTGATSAEITDAIATVTLMNSISLTSEEIDAIADAIAGDGGGNGGGADAVNGASLYTDGGCATCHGASGEGGIGGPVAGLGEAELQSACDSGDSMPALCTPLSASDIADLGAYMETL